MMLHVSITQTLHVSERITQLRTDLEKFNKEKNAQVLITGHSLGGALAHLMMLDLGLSGVNDRSGQLWTDTSMACLAASAGPKEKCTSHHLRLANGRGCPVHQVRST